MLGGDGRLPLAVHAAGGGGGRDSLAFEAILAGGPLLAVADRDRQAARDALLDILLPVARLGGSQAGGASRNGSLSGGCGGRRGPADATRCGRRVQAHGGQAALRPASFWEPLAAVTWQAWLLLLWLAIVLGQLARVASQRWRLARLLGQSAPADAEIAGLVAELAGELGLRRVPAVVSVAGECPLFVCGLWRPQLVLPARLMAALDGSARRQVLLHELAHVRRHDLLWGWPVEIARTVYFFHPLVYWVAYQLRLERELCCDQLAMLHSGHPPADYAQTLVEVVSERSGAGAGVRVQGSGFRGQDFGQRQPEES